MLQLTEMQRAFLSEPHFGVAATLNADGMPHQTVVWYLLEGDSLVMSTPQGSVKHKNLLRDARLSVCAEEGFRYVTVSGGVTFSDDPDRAMYARLGQHYAGSMVQRANAVMPNARTMELLQRERVTIRMEIEKVLSSGLG